jgi:hypothetical protein
VTTFTAINEPRRGSGKKRSARLSDINRRRQKVLEENPYLFDPHNFYILLILEITGKS